MVQAQPQRECRRNAASIGDFGRSNNWANTVQREHPSLDREKSIPRNAIADDANSAAPFAPDKGLPFGIGDTDAFGYASGLWQDMHDMLDCGKTDLGFARLVHFLALAYIVYHSGLTGLMRRTRTFLPL